jgi:hypothetical protein
MGLTVTISNETSGLTLGSLAGLVRQAQDSGADMGQRIAVEVVRSGADRKTPGKLVTIAVQLGESAGPIADSAANASVGNTPTISSGEARQFEVKDDGTIGPVDPREANGVVGPSNDAAIPSNDAAIPLPRNPFSDREGM